jgi:hypothetical protein
VCTFFATSLVAPATFNWPIIVVLTHFFFHFTPVKKRDKCFTIFKFLLEIERLMLQREQDEVGFLKEAGLQDALLQRRAECTHPL